MLDRSDALDRSCKPIQSEMEWKNSFFQMIEKKVLIFRMICAAWKGLLLQFYLLEPPARPLAISNPQAQGRRLPEHRCH